MEKVPLTRWIGQLVFRYVVILENDQCVGLLSCFKSSCPKFDGFAAIVSGIPYLLFMM